MATYTVEQQVQQIYIGLLGRAADKPGLDYWVNEIETNVLSIEELRANIVNEQPEYAAGLGSLSRAQVVAELYQNLFERAPENAGLEYWVNGGGSTVNIDQLVLAMVDGAGAGDRLVMENKTEAATYYTVQAGEDFTRDAANAAVENVDSTRASVEDSKAATDAGTQASGETFTLTTGVDDLNGTNANDTFNGLIDNTTNAVATTLTALDSIEGGAGTDTLKINVVNGAGAAGTAVASLPSISLSSIETINLRSAVDITADMSGAGYADVTTVNSTQAAGGQDLTARAAADVNVSGAAGAITVEGGKDVTVTDNTAAQAITIGDAGALTGNPAGAVTVVDTDNSGANSITVTGGTDVSVEASSEAASGAIVVGDATNGVPSGAVSVKQNLTSEGDVLDNTGNDITVTGGTTVDVTVNGTITADASADDGNALTSGNVSVTGDDNTTSVNVAQNLTANDYEKAAIDDVLPTQVLTFKALAANESTTVGGLTFTASKALTAEQVAAAFSGLTAADTQDSGGKVANGTYTGSLAATWTSGAVSGAAVTFTSSDATAGALTVTAGDVDPASSFTAGTDNSGTAESADVSVAYGTVTVDDGGDDSIATVSVDGYANGSSVTSSALTTLTLANSAVGADFAVDGNSTADASLVLNVDNITSDVGVDNAKIDLTDGTNDIVDVTINATGAASTFILDAEQMESLTINASVGVTIDEETGGTDFANVTAVDINGEGAVDLDDSVLSADGLNSFDASGNTGGVTATVEADAGTLTGDLEEYVLSAGNDDVTVEATTGSAVDVKVTAGAGDDTVTLGSGVNTAGSVIAGGAGTDTLVMDAADAVTASATTTFENSFEGFEKLGLNAASAVGTVDLANMDDISYVVSKNSSAAPVAEVQKFTVTSGANAGGDITVEGVAITLAGTETADQVAAAIAAADFSSTTIASVTANGAELTVTYDAGVDEGDITLVDTDTTGAGFSAVTEETKGGNTGGAGLTLDNMANDGTVELTESGAGVNVDMLDATGSADSLNVKVSNEDTVTAGTVTAADVETINVESNDIFTDTNQDGDDDNVAAHTLTVGGNDATTVVVTGNGNITLTAGSDALTTVDASAMTGNLSYTADGATAGTTVTGGSGDDALIASGSADTLNGGAGDDTLIGANLTQLTGGAGSDTFVMNQPTNVNSYSTITDLEAGDVIDFADNNTFISSAVTLAGTAVFQDYANATVKELDDAGDNVAWFQFDGNTYIVESDGVTTNTADFENGGDSIIQITGLVDLSTASYNQTDGTLEIA